MKNGVFSMISILVLFCISISQAEIISVPLPQFSGVTSATKEFDLGATFTNINSVKLIVSGHATPGRSYDTYQDYLDGTPYDILPARVSVYMPYSSDTGSGYFSAESQNVNGANFTTEVSIEKKYDANWDVLFDGTHELYVHPARYFSFGFGKLVQPTITFSEITIVVDGTLASPPEDKTGYISVPLTQFNNSVIPVNEVFDLETTFSDITSVRLEISGTASPGYGRGDGVEMPAWETYSIPAQITAYMSYPGSGYLLGGSPELNGNFAIEVNIDKKLNANWDVLLDGIHELYLELDTPIVIGGYTEENPSISITEVTMIVEGNIQTTIHEIYSYDNIVYIQELTEFVNNWLQEIVVPGQAGDYNMNGKVDMEDFALLANIWLSAK